MSLDPSVRVRLNFTACSGGTLSGEANNEMDSWANRSSGSSAGYDDPTPDGDDDGCQTWSAVSNDNNVSPFNSDEVSSWRTNRGC